MSSLILTPNFDRPDEVYADLLEAHECLDKAQSDALNARLILVPANHIGDRQIIAQALQAAKQAGQPA